ncbi:MAG: asparaginase [Phycisphaerales bacterium]|nr:asparaginase [Phycisphaerales bacterium]
MKHVLHISTGGTIASSEHGMLGGEVLLKHLRIELPGVRWSHEDAGRIPSSCATPEFLARLALRIDRTSRELQPSMVLVTHGTDTMEEAAAVADMVCGDDVPIVFTGAMRVGPDGDGPRNVAHSVRAGLDSTGPARGVTVVLNGTIHAAIEVRKLHSTADDAFHSSTPLGSVDPDRVQWRGRLPHRLRLPHAEPRHTVRVVRLSVGDSGAQIREAAGSGADGVVIELFGAGNASNEVFDAIESTVESGICVGVTTRCGDGPIRPARPCDRVIVLPGLDALKARLAMMLALASDRLDLLRAWATEQDA